MPEAKNSTRGKRYDDYRKLRGATRAWCEAFARENGYEWCQVDEEELRDSVSEPAALDVWCAVERVVLDARAFVAKHPTDDDGYAVRLRRAVAMFPEITAETPRRWVRRQLLVMEYDRDHRWWWMDRRPTLRDLAVLSILAGEFPAEWARKRTGKGAAGATVLETIAAEERAIRSARSAANPTQGDVLAVSS